MAITKRTWSEVAPIIAIVLGLAWATGSFADFPSDEGPGIVYGKACAAQAGNCSGWGFTCINRTGSGLDDSWFRCVDGGTVYLSIKRNQTRSWGNCTAEGSGCTQYSVYFCAEIYVYADVGCVSSDWVCAYYTYSTQGLCNPLGPG